MELLQEARRLYEAGEMHRALEAAQAAADRHPRDADAWWLLGCVARHVGLLAASDDGFRRAAALSTTRPAPRRMTRAEMEALVETAIAGLDAEARRRLGAGSVRVEGLPPAEAVRRGVAPDALHDRAGADVVLYQDNIENAAGGSDQAAELVRQALQQS